jgi:hypothetical protein
MPLHRQALLEEGADVNAQSGRIGNALRVASSGGHKEIVEMLLEKFAASAMMAAG